MRISQEDGSRLVGQYSRLMAQLEPARLAIYVQSVDAQHLSNLLDVCREFLLVEAEAALLERQGETGRAYELLLGRLRESVDPLFDPSGERARSWDLFRSASQSVFDFCQRQAGRMSEEDRERVWLTLLDHLLAPQRTAKEQPDAEFILSGLREATQRVVTGLQGQVDLTKVLARLIRDPQTTGGTLGDLRHLLMGIVCHWSLRFRSSNLIRLTFCRIAGQLYVRDDTFAREHPAATRRCPRLVGPARPPIDQSGLPPDGQVQLVPAAPDPFGDLHRLSTALPSCLPFGLLAGIDRREPAVHPMPSGGDQGCGYRSPVIDISRTTPAAGIFEQHQVISYPAGGCCHDEEEAILGPA